MDWGAAHEHQEHQQETAAHLLDFSLHLAGNRSFSHLVHEAPPYCYSGMLDPSENVKQATATSMEKDAATVHLMEGLAHTNPDCEEILKDLKDLLCMSVRIIFATYERSKFSIHCVPGRRHLYTLFCVTPDNKSVEDVHQHLNDLRRRQRSQVISKVCLCSALAGL